MAEWSIQKQRCRHNYRDGCRPMWTVGSPTDDDGDNWFSPEFDTWAEALKYVNHELAAAGLGQPQ